MAGPAIAWRSGWPTGHDPRGRSGALRQRPWMIEIVVGDITTLQVDAIVNAANAALRGGGGVDGAIHRAAGPELLNELLRFPSCPTGEAVITRGYRLPAKYVIHAVGPVWRDGREREAKRLESAYESSFARAREHRDIRTIAF